MTKEIHKIVTSNNDIETEIELRIIVMKLLRIELGW